MRFLVDMGVSPRVAEGLRNLGHDAVHLREQGLQKMPDDQVLEKARAEGRILLTMDLDFGQLMAASGGHLPSVVTFRLENESAGNVISRLLLLLARHSFELEQGAVVSVMESTIRVRHLPV